MPEISQAKHKHQQAEHWWRSTKLNVHRQIYQKEKQKVQNWFSPPKPNTITTTPLTLLQPNNSTPVWMNFLALLNPLLCLLLTVQLNCCPCSLLSSLLKFKISTTSLTSHLSSRAFLTHLSPEHRSLVFNLSLKEKYQMLWNQCLSNHVNLTPSLHLSSLPSAITDIVNTSLRTGSFPTAFKTAIVHPFLKKNNPDPNDLKNYHPVSNLPFIAKLLEKIVLQQLNNHPSNNNLLHPFQSAYCSDHSTETVLFHIVNDSLLASTPEKFCFSHF